MDGLRKRKKLKTFKQQQITAINMINLILRYRKFLSGFYVSLLSLERVTVSNQGSCQREEDEKTSAL